VYITQSEILLDVPLREKLPKENYCTGLGTAKQIPVFSAEE
jgi:hypothetical protein